MVSLSILLELHKIDVYILYVIKTLEIQGISLCLLAIIPVGLDGRFVSPGAFPVACGTGTWLLTLGHSLAFGAMFSKIWRVHRLTTKNKSDSKIVS